MMVEEEEIQRTKILLKQTRLIYHVNIRQQVGLQILSLLGLQLKVQ